MILLFCTALLTLNGERTKKQQKLIFRQGGAQLPLALHHRHTPGDVRQ